VELNNRRNDLPVLLIYNLDPSWPQQDIQNCLDALRALVDALVEIGHPVQEVCVQTAELELALQGFSPDDHLIFNWCEELPGIHPSAHLVAQTLEKMGFIFTGADAQALSLSQDKRLVKKRLKRYGIPTPAWKVYSSTQGLHWKSFPAIVKPAFEHCSYGISRDAVVLSKAELVQRVHYVLDELKQPVLVEEFIDGREFHVGVIGNETLRVLPPAEIDYSSFSDIHDRLCTYEANFDEKSLAYQLTIPKLPVILTDNQLSELENVAVAAYKATNCRDFARLDIRLKNGVFYILDVNPNADITQETSLVKAADLAGISYGQLGSLLINLAAQRHANFGFAK
jgi:D-alanine-D-alanine ligase